jgi:integrase
VARILRRAGLLAHGQGKARRYPRETVERLLDEFCRGMGISTSNAYLTAIKGFSRWLVKNRRMSADPLLHLSRLNAQTDIRRERRALPESELRQLLMVAESSRIVIDGLARHDRAMLYAVAMATGFRAGELASLTPRNFDLECQPATVCCRAAYA